MKIAIVHNDYGVFSGEEAVVEAMRNLLFSQQHEVVGFRRSSMELYGFAGSVKGFFCGLGNPWSVRAFRGFLQQEQPDIVHIHNLYPLISPAILSVCQEFMVPVVMTVHNYRLYCPSGLIFRDGEPCELCRGGHEWQCVRHNCEKSYLKSTGYALRNFLARKRKLYTKNVDLFLALSEFQRQKLIIAGFPAEKIAVLPNPLDVTPTKISSPEVGNYIAYAGRLSSEKGIDLILAAAAQLPEIEFQLAGSGREKWEQLATSNVVFRGHLEGVEFDEFWRCSRIVVLASRCYEGFPMILPLAMSYCKPIIVPDCGGLPEIVEHGKNGLLFEFGSAEAMVVAIRSLWNDPARINEMGKWGYRKLHQQYTAECVGQQLSVLYQKVQSNNE